MSTFDTSIRFPIPLPRFVSISQEPALLDYLEKAGGLARREVFGKEVDGDVTRWKVRIAVNESVPAPLRKLLGDSQLTWTNAFVMDHRTQRMTFTVVDSVLTRFFEVKGLVTLHPEGETTTRMDLRAELKSRVPLVGRSLEGFIAEKVLDGWRKDADLRAEYMLRRMQELRDAGQLTPAEIAALDARPA